MSKKNPRLRLGNDSNAYMLMYRLIAPPSERIYSIPDDLIPPEIQDEVMKQAETQKTETMAAIERKAKMQLKIIHIPVSTVQDPNKFVAANQEPS